MTQVLRARWLPAVMPGGPGPSTWMLSRAVLPSAYRQVGEASRSRRALTHQAPCRSSQSVTANNDAHSHLPNPQGDTVIDDLESRGMLHQLTAPNSLRKHLADGKQRTVYVGVDPSADSLHVGNLLPLVAALHFLRHGHRAIIVIGGATGSIGDPSGRDTERQAISPEVLQRNVVSISAQVNAQFERFLWQLARAMESPERVRTEGQVRQRADQVDESGVQRSYLALKSQVAIVNNADWYKGFEVLTFLRDVGKLARVSTMMARDSVKSRLPMTPASLTDGDVTNSTTSSTIASEGLSYTEFSYQLLQAYDFSVLHGEPHNCTIQLGGSDQMGNIMAGIDLIRRQKLAVQTKTSGAKKNVEHGDPAYGLTLPLLTTASGAKFGKSAGNAVWLDKSKCSDYEFYQYFYRARDDEVEKYLKALTLLSVGEIDEIMQKHQGMPQERVAQKCLAQEVTKLVRGDESLQVALQLTKLLYQRLDTVDAATVEAAYATDAGASKIIVRRSSNDILGKNIPSILVDVGFVASRGEGRRAVKSGAVRINERIIDSETYTLSHADLLRDNLLMIQNGRTDRRFVLLRHGEIDGQ